MNIQNANPGFGTLAVRCKAGGINSPAELAKALGVTKGAAKGWWDRKTVPPADMQEAIDRMLVARQSPVGAHAATETDEGTADGEMASGEAPAQAGAGFQPPAGWGWSEDGIEVPAMEIILALIAGLADDEMIWGTSFMGKPFPGGGDGAWGGKSFPATEDGAFAAAEYLGDMDRNNYVSCAAFKPGADARTVEHMAALVRVTLDDVGTKSGRTPPLRPALALLTSPGNWQVSYFLREPERDPGRIKAFLDGLKKQGWGDDAALSRVHYHRIPGTNSKDEYGGAFRTVVHLFDPGCRYTQDELAAAFGIVLPAPGASVSIVARAHSLKALPEHFLAPGKDDDERAAVVVEIVRLIRNDQRFDDRPKWGEMVHAAVVASRGHEAAYAAIRDWSETHWKDDPAATRAYWDSVTSTETLGYGYLLSRLAQDGKTNPAAKALHDRLWPEYAQREAQARFAQAGTVDGDADTEEELASRLEAARKAEEDRKARRDEIDRRIGKLTKPGDSDEVRAIITMIVEAQEDALREDDWLAAIKAATGRYIGTLRSAMKAAKRRLAEAVKLNEPPPASLASVIGRKWIKKNGGHDRVASIAGDLWRYGSTHWSMLDENVTKGELLALIERHVDPDEMPHDKLLGEAWRWLLVTTARPDRPHDRIDPDALLTLNCINGELEVDAKGQVILQPHRPSSWFVKPPSVIYDPRASGKAFQDVLTMSCRRAVGRNGQSEQTELARHVEEVVAYSVRAYNKLKQCFLFMGGGDDGKSLLWRLVTALIGGDQVLGKSVGELNDEDKNYVWNQLLGKRIWLDDDVGKNTILNDGVVKSLADVPKLRSARRKYRGDIEFTPRAVLVMLSNNKPKIRDLTQAMRHRVSVIPLDPELQEHEKDRDLGDRLTNDPQAMSGMLNVLIEAARRMAARGDQFDVPSCCVEAHEAWLSSANPLVKFLGEVTVRRRRGDKRAPIRVKTLYDLYRQWLKAQGGDPRELTRGSFIEGLEALRHDIQTRGNQQVLPWLALHDAVATAYAKSSYNVFGDDTVAEATMGSGRHRRIKDYEEDGADEEHRPAIDI